MIKGKFWKDYADLEAFDAWEKMSSDEIMGKINDILEKGKKVKMPKNLVTAKNQLREQSVRHGSPYEFDKFDSSHMGEWEWAQAHGRGHYVAVDEKTWRHYADMWWRKLWLWEYKWKSYDKLRDLNLESERWRWGISSDDLAWFRVLRNIDNKWFTVEEAIKDLTDKQARFIEDVKWYIKNWWDEYLTAEEWKQELPKIEADYKALKWLKAEDFKLSNRNLYEVDIPDPKKADTPTGSNYIEEDWKITYQQVEKLADSLEKYDERGKRWKYRFLEWIVRDLDNLSWWRDYKLDKYVTKWDITWKKLYEHLVDYFWGRERWEKQASKFLENLWYDWIHYFWGRDWEAYVIFNDNTPVIKNHTRYQKNWVTSNGKNSLTSRK